MRVKAIKTSIFKEGDDLYAFITRYVERIYENTVFVVTSKIVSLSEKRTLPAMSKAAKERLIQRESDWAMKCRWGWLTITQGMVMFSAGIDESNADGRVILLPQDSFRTASQLRRKLMKQYKVKKFGILITDSRLFPLRAGIVGVALGYAGFKGVKDNRGKKDLSGRKLKMSRADVADALATSAVLTMGEAAESRPLALIERAPIEFVERINRRELLMDVRDDAYLPLFKNTKQIRMKKIRGPWSKKK